jgi:hypothetical protein
MRSHGLLFVLLLTACGGSGSGGDLDRSTVTALPSGDAVGTSLSKRWKVVIYIRDCSGICKIGGQSQCDVGEKQTIYVDSLQHDGALQLDSDSLLVSRLTGGVWKDGHFDVGGYATQLGGSVQITARARGSFGADEGLTAQALVHGAGSADGQSVDCYAAYDVTASP